MRNVGLRMGSKPAKQLQREIAGLFNQSSDWQNSNELVAYSLEREATGRHNKLSGEIARLFLERMLE